jgi:hypothetical protein
MEIGFPRQMIYCTLMFGVDFNFWICKILVLLRLEKAPKWGRER